MTLFLFKSTKTKRKIQTGSIWTRWWHERRLGFGVWCDFCVLIWWVHASAGFSRKDGLAALRPQSRTHGFKASVFSDSLYINIVNIQITNLVVERKIFAEQRIKFSQFKNLPTYLSFFVCSCFCFALCKQRILTWYIFVHMVAIP